MLDRQPLEIAAPQKHVHRGKISATLLLLGAGGWRRGAARAPEGHGRARQVGVDQGAGVDAMRAGAGVGFAGPGPPRPHAHTLRTTTRTQGAGVGARCARPARRGRGRKPAAGVLLRHLQDPGWRAAAACAILGPLRSMSTPHPQKRAHRRHTHARVRAGVSNAPRFPPVHARAHHTRPLPAQQRCFSPCVESNHGVCLVAA